MINAKAHSRHLSAYARAHRDLELTGNAIDILERVTGASHIVTLLKRKQKVHLGRMDEAESKMIEPPLVMNIKPYAGVLRKEGFVMEYDSRAGGIRVVQFIAQRGNRQLRVQLWANGEHSADHMLSGRGSTRPTHFTTVDEMLAAIKIEETRTDHKPRC